MPLIGLALTLFGLVMIIIAKDWVNIVWPVIVLFLIFKGFKKTDTIRELLAKHTQLQGLLDKATATVEQLTNRIDDLSQQPKNNAQQTAGTKEVSVLGTAAQKPVRKRQAKRKKSVAEIKADIKDVSSNLEKK